MAVATFEEIRTQKKPPQISTFEEIRRNPPQPPQKSLIERLEPTLTGLVKLEDVLPEEQRTKIKSMIDLQPEPDKFRQRLTAEMLLADRLDLDSDNVSINFDTITKEYFGQKLSDSDVIMRLSPYRRLPEFTGGPEQNWFSKAFNTVRGQITEKTGMFAPYQGEYAIDEESGKIYKSAEKGPIGKLLLGEKPLPAKETFKRKGLVEAGKEGLKTAGVRMTHSIAGQVQLAGDVTGSKNLSEWGKVMAQAADEYYAEHPEEMMQLAQNRGLLGTTWQFITRPELIVQGVSESVPMLLEAYLGHITGTKAASVIGKGSEFLPWAGRVTAIANQSFGDTYANAREQGTEPAAALTQAILTGTIEGAIEEWTLGKKVEIFQNALGATARRGLAQSAADMAMGSLKAYGRGAAEEFTQQMSQNLWQMIFSDKKPLIDNFSKRLFEGSIENAASGGLLEMAMAGMFEISGSTLNLITDKEKLSKITNIRGLVDSLPNLKKEQKTEINNELDKVQVDILAGKFNRAKPAGEVTARFTEQIKKNFNIDDNQARAGLALVEARAESQGLSTDDWITKNIANVQTDKPTADVLFQEEPYKIDDAADNVLDQAKNAGVVNQQNESAVLSLAGAIAGMSESDTIKAEHIAEAIQYIDPKWIKEIITPKTTETLIKGKKTPRITGGPGSPTYERLSTVYEKAGLEVPTIEGKTQTVKTGETKKASTGISSTEKGDASIRVVRPGQQVAAGENLLESDVPLGTEPKIPEEAQISVTNQKGSITNPYLPGQEKNTWDYTKKEWREFVGNHYGEPIKTWLMEQLDEKKSNTRIKQEAKKAKLYKEWREAESIAYKWLPWRELTGAERIQARIDEKQRIEKYIKDNPDDPTVLAKHPDGGDLYLDIYGEDWIDKTQDERDSQIQGDLGDLGVREQEKADADAEAERYHQEQGEMADAKNREFDRIIDYVNSKGFDADNINNGYSGFGSKYLDITNPDTGEYLKVRVSDHYVEGGAGFNMQTGERHSAPDLNFVLSDKDSVIDLSEIDAKIKEEGWKLPEKSAEKPSEKAKVLKPSVKKAAVEFLDDGKAVLRAFEKADLSSFVHETAHIFRRTLDKDSITTVEQWAGVKEGKWEAEHEEKFARGFERYLYEGKSPNQKLRNVFAKLREWLRQIYTSLKGSVIDITMTDDIKRVFDKMLTAPAEIHPGEMTFDEFFEKLGKELEKPQSRWVERYALKAGETPLQMHKRLITELQARQSIETKKSKKSGEKLSTAQKKQIEQLEAEAATASQEIMNSEKEKTIGELLEASNADELILDEFKDRLQTAYIAGKEAGIENQKNRYKEVKQRATARKELREYIKQLGRAIAKPAPWTVEVYHREAIAILQAGIDPSFRMEKTLEDRDKIRKFLEKYPNRDMPAKIMDIIGKKSLNEYTITELEKLAEERKRLEQIGKKKKELRKIQDDRKIEEISAQITNNIRNRIKEKKPQYQSEPVDLKNITVEETLNADGTKTGKYLIYYRESQIVSSQVELQKGKTIEQLKNDVKGWLEAGGDNVINAATSKKAFTKESRAWFWASFLTPSRVFDLLDEGKATFDGVAHQTFYDAANDADSAKKIIIKARLKEGKTILAELGLTEQDLADKRIINGKPYNTEEIVGVYGLHKNSKSRLALMYGNKIPMREIADIIHHCEYEDPRLGKLADAIMREYDQNFDRLENAYIEAEDRRVEKEDNYLPMIRKDTIRTDESLEQQLEFELKQKNFIKRAYAEKGFTISRQDIDPEFQKEIRLDIWTTWAQQVEKQEHYIHFAKLVRDLHRIERNTYLQDAVREKFGDVFTKSVTNYVSRVANPYIFKAHGWGERVSRLLRSNVAIAYLAYNVVTSVKQLPALLYYLPDAGLYYTTASLIDFSKHPLQMIKFVRDLDILTEQQRALDTTLQEIKEKYAGEDEAVLVEKLFGQTAADVAGGTLKLKHKIGRAGTLPIEWLDTITRTIGWNAVYQKALAENKSQGEAIRLARNSTLRTQNAAAQQDLPEVYTKGEAARWMLMFSNQVNKMLNVATYDIPRQAASGQKVKAALGLLGLSIGALMMWSISHRRLPEDEEDIGEALYQQAIDIVPASRMFTTNFGSGVPLQDEARKLYTGVINLEADKILESTAALYGVPTIGPKRVYKTFETGNPLELVGGKPRK